MKLKSVIVDDEKHGRENLAGLLKRHCPLIEVAGVADSVENAIKLIEKKQPDIVFLDIEMPGANGFDLLESFSKITFEVIFVTAYDNYAIKAIKFSAADYILKPINISELKQAINKLVERIRHREENQRIRQLYQNIRFPSEAKIGLPSADRVEFVDVQSIIRLQGESNYTHVIFTNRNPLLIAKTLVEFEELLNDHNFLRIHKTHLVNLHHVSAFLRNDGGYLQLTNGEKIPVSRRRKEEVLRKMKLG